MKVVVGMDVSKYSRWALEWVARLAVAAPPPVVALHAVDLSALKAPVMFQPMVVGNEPFVQAEVKSLDKKAKEVVAETKRSLDSFNLQGRVTIEKGAPADIIVKRARRGDLVIVGHRGLAGSGSFYVGERVYESDVARALFCAGGEAAVPADSKNSPSDRRVQERE